MQPADLDALATELEEQLLGLDPTGPRVVAIGGGHGLAAALVAAQSYASQITAIVSVAGLLSVVVCRIGMSRVVVGASGVPRRTPARRIADYR